ncbi:MAG: hypothetical protein CMJ78_08925 [Planctomycetaceae bacterium]|nr:hypothetical protein [Planctomycetaceae bacterium]
MPKKNKPRRHDKLDKTRIASSANSVSADPLAGVLCWITSALIAARWVLPVESAGLGETLWIVQLWLFLAVFWTWTRLRSAENQWKWGRVEWALTILVLAQTASGLHIVLGQGDRRSALNLIWEWIGLGILFFIARHVLNHRAIRSMIVSFAAVAVSLSGLGIWQHYVWYPSVHSEYEALRKEFDMLDVAPMSASAREARRSEILREFQSQGIPLEGRSRMLWEQRLKNSREPFGLFALANSFAGFLVAWLVVLCGMLWSSISALRRGKLSDKKAIVWTSLAVLVVGFCLVLTKSRTSLVAFFAAITLLTTLQWRLKRSREEQPNPEDNEASRRQLLIPGIFANTMIVGVIGLTAISGGIDREVWSEAPKSLLYRLEYWTATSQVIADQPWLGTGPGNFRTHYLKHKLPGSSEEVADPHNLFLDVWANAGLGGLLGLGLLLAFGVAAAWKLAANTATQEPPDKVKKIENILYRPVASGTGFGLLLPVAFQWLMATPVDARLLCVFIGWLVMMLGFQVTMRHVPLDANFLLPGTLMAALVGLTVHLLGAGGIAMPGITQVVLILVLANLALQETPKPAAAAMGDITLRDQWPNMALMGVAVMAFLTCLMTSTVPVINRNALTIGGDSRLMASGDSIRAAQFYTMANTSDPFSLEPVDRLAQLEYREWKKSFSAGAARFERAVEFAELALRSDPENSHRYRQLGEWYREHFEATKSAESAKSAAKHFEMAVERYPSNPEIRVLAAQFPLTPAAAASHAKLALEFDALNRKAGHVDRYLPDESIEAMRAIVEKKAD